MTTAPAVFLMGPTASGKTGAAVALAAQLPVEIISVDSALVYRDMDIGTAKPDADILQHAPHHLINLMPPTQAYSAANFRQDALRLMADITARGHIPLLVGGTMLYFKALEHGMGNLPEADPIVREALDAEAAAVGWPAMHAKLASMDAATAARLAPNDSQRIQRALEVFAISGRRLSDLIAEQSGQALPYRVLKLALMPSERKALHERIALRFEQMLAAGLVDEVRALLKKYPELTTESTAMRCVGYRQTLHYLAGDMDIDALRERGIFATRQLAKRQLTWLRGMSQVQPLDCLLSDLNDQVINQVNQFIKNR